MVFLISVETPNQGSCTRWSIEIPHEGESMKRVKEAAQMRVAELLVGGGCQRNQMTLEVTTNSQIDIGPHRIAIIPLVPYKPLNTFEAAILVALLR